MKNTADRLAKQAALVLAFLALAVLPMQVAGAVAPADPPAGSNFEQRLAQRKAEQAVTLDPQLETRLKGRCITAQTNLRSYQQDVTESLARRSQTYDRIDAKLWTSIGKLKLANQDTFKLEGLHGDYNQRVAAITKSIDNYKQSIDDLLVINCQADLAGFQALLLTAREYHQQIRTQSADIHKFIVEQIKTQLSDEAAKLRAAKL